MYIYVCRVYMSPLAEKPANIFIRFNSSSLTMPGAGGGGDKGSLGLYNNP